MSKLFNTGNNQFEEEVKMSNLVKIENNQAVTTSLKVAKHFKDGRHFHVVRDIKRLIEQISDQSKFGLVKMFVESSYVDKKGETRPMYLMNRDGFTLLVMGYEGKEAMQFKLKYIEAFNAMEAKLKEQSIQSVDDIINNPRAMIKILTALADEQDKNKQLTNQLEIAKPKAEYYDEVLDSSSLIKTTVIAKEYGLSAIKLHRLLEEWGIIFWQNNVWVIYQDYADKGYAGYRTYSYLDDDGVQQTSKWLSWTEKGKEFIHKLLKSHGYIKKC